MVNAHLFSFTFTSWGLRYLSKYMFLQNRVHFSQWRIYSKEKEELETSSLMGVSICQKMLELLVKLSVQAIRITIEH